jgi:FKBP-type peptidyl-prolyl cis-trans isomerase FklB
MKIQYTPQVPARAGTRFNRVRRLWTGAFVGAFALFAVAGCDTDGGETEDRPGGDAVALDNDIAYASYGLGHHLISSIRQQFGDALDLDALIVGVRDGYGDAEPQVSQEQFMAGMRALGEAGEAERVAQAGTRLAEGRAFLAENAQRDGVVTLESGLQYEVLEEGTGPRPDHSDVVSTHYEGRLLSGETFDSSMARGEPARFPVDGVIEGWVEALQLMPVGSKWRLYVPPELAYGEQGAGGVIGPNETLIFDVELLEIVDGAPEDDPAASGDATQ